MVDGPNHRRSRVVCFWLAPIPYRNMAVRRRILNLSQTVTLTLVTVPGELPAEIGLTATRVVVFPLGRLRWIRLPRSVSVLWAAVWLLVATRRGEFDVAYSFQDYTALLGFTAKVLRRARRWVWDVLDDPALGLKTADAIRVDSRMRLGVLRAIEVMKRGAGRGADGVITTAVRPDDPLPMLLRREYGIPLSRLLCVPNGVDLSVTRRVRPAPHNNLIVFYVGSVSRARGLDVLLMAMARVASEVATARLILAGSVPKAEQAWIKDRINAARLQAHVELAGPIPSERAWELMEQATVCVYPFHRTELSYVFPVKVYEYLALGRPVVASRLHGVSEIITDGVNGLLVEPGDANGMASAILRLWRDPRLRARLESAARPSVERFDWSRIDAEINAWIADLT